MSMSRRDFFKNAATQAAVIGFISAGGLELRANPLGMPIGCQTWPVRDMVAKDFPGTIKQLAEAGFQTIELCSPVGYADSGFAGLAKYSGTELRRILGDAGVTCVSSHFSITELDRKSTRLNSSHGYISYAVFCLKKKNIARVIGASHEHSVCAYV